MTGPAALYLHDRHTLGAMLTLPASGFVSHETIRPARLKQTESSQGRVVLLELAHPAVTSEDDLVQRTDERK